MMRDLVECNMTADVNPTDICNNPVANSPTQDKTIAHGSEAELAAKLANLFTISEEGKRLINPETEYIAKFTPKLLELMDEHDVQFLKDKATGELLPDLYDYTNKGLGGKVRLEVRSSISAQDLLNFNIAANNLMLQQKIEELAVEIRKIQRIAVQIERGQDNDRFAKVEAGRNMFQQALRIVDDNDLKRKMIVNAIALLNEGRALIEKTIIEKLNVIEGVPKNLIVRTWKIFIGDGYLEDKRSEYRSIQEYFYYYCMALEPLAYAYYSLSQTQLIEEVLLESKGVLEHPRLEVLRSFEPLLSEKPSEDVWYLNADKYEKELMEAYSENKPIEISITGQQLLEAIDNEGQ